MDVSVQLLLVTVVLAGMLVGLFFLKRAGWVTTSLGRATTGNRVRELRVIERVVVSAQHTLVLVEVNSTRMLVCLSPAASNVTILSGEQPNCSR